MKSADVKAKPIIAIISHMEMELVGQGNDQKKKPVLYLEDRETHGAEREPTWRRSEEAFGDSDEWPGHRIKVKCERTQFQGKTTDGLRIDPIIAKPAAKNDELDDESGI